MKYHLVIILFILHNALLQAQIDCENDSVGLIPINDLGSGTFMGYEGGLYPGGQNERPAEHTSFGEYIAYTIKPLDTAGNPDWENGSILLAGLGASTAGSTFGKLKEIYSASSLTNECLGLVQMTFGGKGLESMIAGNSSTYWRLLIDSVLTPKGYTAKQIQVAWIKSASKDDSINEFPLQADSIYSKYIQAINRTKNIFPNLKLLYISSHAYGGYAGEFSDNVKLVGEPASYYGGFSVKWLIESQINGDERLKYKGANINAPWISWAPYYWADGINPRETDGLFWECSDYEEDGGGFHHTESGKTKEAEMLFDFFYNDPTSSYWFRNDYDCYAPLVDIQATPESKLTTVYPNPSNGVFTIETQFSGEAQLRIYDMTGRLCHAQQLQCASGDQLTINTSITQGVYLMQLEGNQVSITEQLMVR